MKKASLVACLVALAYSAGSTADWASKVTKVKTCKHPSPTQSGTIIQISFADGKSLVLDDHDYAESLFKNFISIALTAFSTGKPLRVEDANPYQASYCSESESTHSGGNVSIQVEN